MQSGRGRSRRRAATSARARVGDERAEHDPRAVPARDQQRVLAVEADARARGGLAVDVVVRVDEHAVGAAEPAAERVELLAELRVVSRHVYRAGGPPRPGLGPGRVVAERGGDDGAGAGEQQLRVAGDLGAGDREAHVREQAARAALADVPLGLAVGLGGRRAD